VQECVNAGLKLADSEEVCGNDFLKIAVDGVPGHPNLDRHQSSFIWRPENPIYVEYENKKE
jgi:hypothetical protein